ncbi:transcriptional regulator [Actinocatenispora thailandica]|uniref:Transcriptional regulator n=1 Tax=Actinocatenispora thailandica TaxID=227318 RepID=A0A7R7DJS8_9ACTN|nr:helix-turn-helix domain-containing protein [Actinocatenispora thailandica]BCJ32861.1 transcriptional regulator [Actinocatenispora thailandica]
METIDDQLEHRYDAYLAQCPCRPLLDVIANKWTALIVGALLDREHRFGELRREIEGISQKVLTANLRALERNGFVARRVYPTSPPAVGYSLTALGRSLAPPLVAVREWTERHMDDVEAARARYDTGLPVDVPRSVPDGADPAAEPAAAR